MLLKLYNFITEEDTSDEDFFGEDSDFFKDLLDEDEEREEKQRGLEVQASKFMPVNQQVWSLKIFGSVILLQLITLRMHTKYFLLVIKKLAL